MIMMMIHDLSSFLMDVEDGQSIFVVNKLYHLIEHATKVLSFLIDKTEPMIDKTKVKALIEEYNHKIMLDPACHAQYKRMIAPIRQMVEYWNNLQLEVIGLKGPSAP